MTFPYIHTVQTDHFKYHFPNAPFLSFLRLIKLIGRDTGISMFTYPYTRLNQLKQRTEFNFVKYFSDKSTSQISPSNFHVHLEIVLKFGPLFFRDHWGFCLCNLIFISGFGFETTGSFSEVTLEFDIISSH
jgi:hypothetical protein